MRILLTVLLTLFVNNCWAGWDTWSDDDRKLFIASNIAIAADWGTTLDIARNPTKYREAGPIAKTIIGDHPSVSDVNRYFIVRSLLNYYTADLVGDKDRSLYFMIVIGTHGFAGIHNYQAGLRIRF